MRSNIKYLLGDIIELNILYQYNQVINTTVKIPISLAEMKNENPASNDNSMQRLGVKKKLTIKNGNIFF